jgi:uncharacterized protein YjbK
MDNLLLEIGGKELYLDIDRLSEIVRIEPNVPVTEEGEEDSEVYDEAVIQVDVTKYEMYREMIGTLLTYNEEYDEKMGLVALNKATIPFKLSYNTLLMKSIIKEL